MRSLYILVAATTLAAVAACGDDGSGASSFPGNPDNGDAGNGGPGIGFDGALAETAPPGTMITSMRVDPADAVITLNAPGPITQTYRVLASINGNPETDITARSVFYVPDNYL